MSDDINIENLSLPDDLEKLSLKQCYLLCRQIRKKLIGTVAANGGHLASNLGVVELTLALHRVFDSPKDKILWDVGHQSYTHKILTGRYDDLSTIRKENGISGFTRPSESVHDAFIGGHSSTSVSAACGIARAMKLDGDRHSVIAVLGDGAFTGGEAYEGLNNAGKELDNLIVILNNNEMSISRNVGGIAKYLTEIRGREAYINTKQKTADILKNVPFVGDSVIELIKKSKSALKWMLFHSTLFEDLGFVYLGPVDGHDISALEEVLRAAKRIDAPVLIHVNTVKGKGFRKAENNPGAFHGVSAYEFRYGNPEVITEDSFSAVSGKYLTKIAKDDEDICTVTAAMKYGTGLQYFAAEHPDRFFDVGIAEQHAVTFCSGLASMGKKPVFAVYSSFLQRGFDQILHDCAIMKTHVVFAVDRAGIVGEDGETHHGLYDTAMFSLINGSTVYSPFDYSTLELCLDKAIYGTDGVAVVRYPKGHGENFGYTQYSDHVYINNKSKTLCVTYGRIYTELLKTSGADTLALIKIMPIEDEIYDICMSYDRVIFFEEGTENGGIGQKLFAELSLLGYRGETKLVAVKDFVPQSSVGSALHRLMLDSEGMQKIIDEKI